MQSNKKITDKRRFSVVMKITAIVIVMAILIGSTATMPAIIFIQPP